VAEPRQVYPLDHPLYDTIRELCVEQVHFEYLEFAPLFDKHVKVLAVSGGVDLGRADEEVVLTFWKGTKDGTGKSGSPKGAWIRIEAESPDQEPYSGTHCLDPDVPVLDPAVAGFIGLPLLECAVQLLQELLAAAEQTHAGLVGAARQQSFDQLNETVQDGFDEAEWDDDDDDDTEDDDAHDLMLHILCSQSGFRSIRFGLMPRDGIAPFTTSAVLGTDAGPVSLMAWVASDTRPGEPRGQFWLEVDGHRQKMPAEGTEKLLPAPEGGALTRDQLHRAIWYLRPIHTEAFGVYLEQIDLAGDEACEALGAVALNALDGGDPMTVDDVLDEPVHDHGHDHPAGPAGREWHSAVDDFTRQCRLGFLFHVAVQESPRGGFDLSAAITPPSMEELTTIKVFMHQGELEDRPGHWYAAADVICPAHGEGADLVGLLNGFPVQAQAFIGHSLEHLHAMSHLVQDVVMEKVDEVLRMTESVRAERDVSDEVLQLMVGEAVADSLAGFNGIARMHTGTAELPIPGGDLD
jgi:hypothetical protein